MKWNRKIICLLLTCLGPVTNAKHIKADTPKILMPTHFWRTKNIKANIFLALINIKHEKSE
jgi:hypothetical protein